MEHLRYYGLYRNEHLDFKEEMDRIRRLKGKFRKWRHHKGDEWKKERDRRDYGDED